MNPGGYVDTLGMWEATASIPEQMATALMSVHESLATGLPPDVESVAVFGVGAGGTVAEAVAAYAATASRLPVWAGAGPDVPTFVDRHTQVLCVSTSGASEETLDSAMAAHARGASVVAVSGGGALSAWAETGGVPHLRLADSAVPRSSMVGALVLALGALSGLGLIEDVVPALSAAEAPLQRRRDVLLALSGPADEMARRIGRTIPLVYGATGLPGVAAEHWKRQFNQNVKTPAFSGVVPDVAHHEVSGWGQHGDVTRQVLTLIPLRQHGEQALVAQRFERVLAAMDEVMAGTLAVWAEGESGLGRFLDLVLFGDFVSLHLAGREGIDPGPLAAQP